jgi:hypothetical protein
MATEEHSESFALQTEQTRTMHRALVSVMEELEAIDWYQQRADAHDQHKVHLFLTESFAFRVLERGVAVYLKPKRGKK